MSGNRAIDPLPLEDFPQESDTQDPGFEQLFNDLVGDAGTDADGFDAAVEDASSILDSLDASLTELGGQDGGTLDDTFADVLSVDPQPALDDVVNLVAATNGLQTNVDNLGNDLTAAALPSPSGGAPPPPPSTAPGCATFTAGNLLAYEAAVGTIRHPFTLKLTNTTGSAFTITGTVWDPSEGFFAVVQPDPTGTVVQPGQTTNIDLLLAFSGPGQYTTTLTIQTTAPDPQPCIVVTAQFVGGSGGGIFARCNDPDHVWGC